MDLARVTIVLVRPSRPANVAAACRAMKNMGLRKLRIVDPPEGLDDWDTRAPAYKAWDILDGAEPAATLSEAVADSTLVVGTTGREDVSETWTPRQLASAAAERGEGEGVAVVFGPESSGLTSVELGLCHALVHVPTDPAQPSLNLAQAVLLLAYELRLAASPEEETPEGDVRASAGMLEEALQELRRLTARAGLTPREVTLLRGLARQISWAGRIARGGPTAS